MKQKLTNTIKHAEYGTIAGSIALVVLWLLGVIFSDYKGDLNWFACIAWAFLVLNYEKNQCLAYIDRNKLRFKADRNIFGRIWDDLKRTLSLLKWSNLKLDLVPIKEYLRLKWLDTIIDILAGIIPFLLIMKAGGMI